MKLLFCDFDGVLNSTKYFSSSYFRDSQKSTQSHLHHLDPEAVSLLNDLVFRSQAIPVVSSSWRLIYSIQEINDMLSCRGSQFAFIDKTPENDLSLGLREREIKAYLASMAKPPESYVILDDIHEFPTIPDQFIQTDADVGLTRYDIECALKVLNRPL